MHVGWTRPGVGVLRNLDERDEGPTSVRGDVMDYEAVQLAGDGELIVQSPYLTYAPETTRVVTFCLSLNPEVPARRGAIRVASARKAREWCSGQNLRVLDENAAGDHLFLRVPGRQK